jgi:hypothetical protein
MDVDEGEGDPTSGPESEEGFSYIEVSISLSYYQHGFIQVS